MVCLDCGLGKMRRPAIGFVLLTHRAPHQILRLVTALNSRFGIPPIACHHDFAQCAMEESLFPANVRFVLPSIATAWGSVAMADAVLAALRLLHSSDLAPAWTILLSGADYPIKSAARILADLEAGDADAYIQHRLINEAEIVRARELPEACPHGVESRDYLRVAYGRYCARFLSYPVLAAGPRIEKRALMVRSKLVRRIFTPFRPGFECFAGEAWWTLNRRSVSALLSSNDQFQKLRAHYANRLAADESYVQTILCNQPDLRVSYENFRYVDWRNGGYHPKTLVSEDLPALRRTSAHFARKFDLSLDSQVFQSIDESFFD